VIESDPRSSTMNTSRSASRSRKWAAAELAPYSEQWRPRAWCPSRPEEGRANRGICACGPASLRRRRHGGHRYDHILIRTVARRFRVFHGLAHNASSGPYLNNLATDEQKARWLPGCVSGDSIPVDRDDRAGHCSDLAGMKTRARTRATIGCSTVRRPTSPMA